jgi:hypothetical protein
MKTKIGKLMFNLFKQSKTYQEFEDFKSCNPWFLKPYDKVRLTEGSITPNTEFASIFPNLNKLITSTRVLNVAINKDHYKLYSWIAKDGKNCGWLCQFEDPNLTDIELLLQHQLLLTTMGGIKKCYNEPDGSFTNNQNFLFIKSKCKRGPSYWTEYYHDMCQEEGIQPIPVDDLVSFVYEANGAQTLYDLKTGQVYLFSHDHNFDYVNFMQGQPKYTFHYINGVKSFTQYVETLATQWLYNIL